MKNIFKLFLLSPVVFSTVGCQNKQEPVEPKPVDVVVISGQSNAVGCTHISCIQRSIGSEKYREYMRGYEGIQIAYDSWTKDEGPKYYSQNKSKDNGFVKVMLVKVIAKQHLVLKSASLKECMKNTLVNYS